MVTENDIDRILIEKFKDLKCPSCGKNGIYAGCVDTQYDENHDINNVLSFDVFCKDCGNVLGKWENTDRQYFLGKR